MSTAFPSVVSRVNSWGDYTHWRRTRIWYMKSYRERGMRLPILHTNFNRGIVNFNEERPYYLTYILRDYQGNEARYHFTVQGQRDSRIQPSDSSMRQVPCRSHPAIRQQHATGALPHAAR